MVWYVKMEDDEQIQDRLTDLPNEIIHQILSLITTKSVIISSSLSQKWRHIAMDHLAYANNLDFGEDFSRGQNPNQVSDNLNRVLRAHVADKIDRFRLLFSPRNEQHKASAISWIQFATLRGVKDLDLDFCRHIQQHFLSRAHVMCRNEAFELPSFLCDCETLVSLRIRRCILTLPEKYAGFGNLHTLGLKEVHVTDIMLDSLLGNCPLLEVLILKECGSLSRIRILACTKLKKLTIYECLNASVIEIRGPKIRSLLISSGHLDSCNLEDLQVLEEAFVGTRGDEFGGVLNIFIKAWSNLAHVKALTLYLGHLVPILIKDLKVKFINLQELQLVNSPSFGLFDTDVYCFFRHFTCPSLQRIYIQLSTVSEEENFIWEHRKPNIKPINCIFDSLKTVELRNFRGSSSDTELAAYFLERAPVLESLLLVPPHKFNTCSTSKEDETIMRMRMEVLDVLVNRPKTSTIVEIKVGEIDRKKTDSLLSFLKWHHVSDVYHK